MKDRIERIKQKIKDKEIELNPCLTVMEIELFEEKHKVKLPEEYRLFLLEIGNGGDGLNPEIEPVGRLATDMDGWQKDLWENYPNISRPFPFIESWEESPNKEGRRTEADWDKYYSTTNGSLYISNVGCGQYWLLIITGAERGNIWSLSYFGISPTFPRKDFLSWFEDCLDGACIRTAWGNAVY